MTEPPTWLLLDAKEHQTEITELSTNTLTFTDVAKASRLNALLVETIDESLTSLLSRKVADALFARLETQSVTKDQVSYQLDMVHAILERIFGPSATTIEKDIMKRLHAKLGISFIDDSRMVFGSHAIFLKLLTATELP